MNGFFVFMCPKVCIALSQESSEQQEAYKFAKSLTSLVKHPILLNAKANLTAYRLLLGLTDKKYRTGLNNAVRYGYIKQEGNNLRLISKSQERKQFKARNYNKIKVENINEFYNLAIIEPFLKKQQRGINYHSTATTKKAGSTGVPRKLKPFEYSDKAPILSIRSAARILNKTVTTTTRLLAKLKPFGLVLTQNRTQISKSDFKYLLSTGSKSIRFNNGAYSYIGATFAEVKNAFTVLEVNKYSPNNFWDSIHY